MFHTAVHGTHHCVSLPVQMLLQKLRGSHCCLLDVAPFPLGELGGLKVSRSGVDSGIGESVATGSLTHSATAPPADRPQSPGPKNHSVTLHNLVQLCLQQQPERRWSHDSRYKHKDLHANEVLIPFFCFPQTLSICAVDARFLQAGGFSRNHFLAKLLFFWLMKIMLTRKELKLPARQPTKSVQNKECELTSSS